MCSIGKFVDAKEEFPDVLPPGWEIEEEDEFEVTPIPTSVNS